MGSDRVKIRYVIFKRGHWVWRPTKTTRAAGFRPVHLSAGHVIDGTRVMSARDIERARALNAEWDRHRRGLPRLAPRLGYPMGSIGEGYGRALRLREQERKNKGVVWPRSSIVGTIGPAPGNG